MINFKARLLTLLNEQSDILTESIADIRKNPPKFTPKQIKNNAALFGFVGSIITKMFKEKNMFKGIAWTADHFRIVKYITTYNIPGNKYYRNSIWYRDSKWLSQRQTNIELLTDSVNNTVQLIYRKSTMRSRIEREVLDPIGTTGDIHKQLAKRGNARKLLQPIAHEIARQLQTQGGEDVTIQTIDTGSQHGYVIKFKSIDYSKLKNTQHVVSKIMPKNEQTDDDDRFDSNERNRQQRERELYRDQ